MKIYNLVIYIFFALAVFTGCTQQATTIDDSFLGGVSLSLSNSTISSSATSVVSGNSVTITLSVKDQSGNAFYVPNSNPVVVFSASGGTSTGTFGSVTDLKNGTFTTTFTGTSAGTATSITATVAGKSITASTSVQVTAAASPPGAFTISSATITTGGTVRITWGASSGATSYTLKYGTSSGSYGTTFSTTATSPTDVTGLTGGTTYYFMVTAVNSDGTRNATAEVSAAAIASFTLSSVTPATGSAAVAWSASAGSTSYDILYDTTSRISSGSYASSMTSVTSGSTVSSLSAGTTYYFRVRANGAAGSVLSTNEISSAVYQNFTLNIPFTAGSDTSYTISDSTRVDLTGGVVRLTPSSQTDSSSNTTASSGGFMNGTLTGVQWDNTNGYVRLNTSTNNSDLDVSWTPSYSNLVGYWKLENNGNDSVSTNNATTVGTVTYSSSAKVGSYAAVFPGTSTDYLSVNDNDSLDNTQKLSISFWVYPTTLDGTARGIISKRNATNDNEAYALFFYTSNQLYVDVDGTGDRFSTNTVFVTNNWYHVVLTFDGTLAAASRVSIYVNGVLDKTSSETTSTLPNYNSALLFGRLGGSTGMAGRLDEVAIWNGTALTAANVQTIYNRQSAKYAGQLTSRVLDAFSSQSWTTLSSTSTLPFYKELPISASNETSTNYSSIGGSLNANLEGLWHLNEASGTTGANSVIDSSSKGYNGTPSGTINFAKNGVLGNAAEFVGSSISVSTTNLKFPGNASYSSSLWLKTTISSGYLNLLNSRGSDGSGNQGWIVYIWGGDGKVRNARTLNSTEVSAVSTTVNDGNWHHIASTYDGSSSRIYVDGVLVATQADTASLVSAGTSFVIGGSSGTGSMDEVAVWSRTLSLAEIKTLYRRGANRLKYQVRSCSAADCSDQDALTSSYKGWKGPDNTGLSYFSELYNTTSNVLAGTVATGSPTMTFSNFSGSGLSVSSNRYFQYRAILESDDQNSLCNYGSGAVSCSPELQSVVVGPTHYDTTIQSVISKASIGSAYQAIDANGMTETLGTNSCSSTAKYSLSSDGSTFYYWNGSAWATSSSYATANDVATMKSNLATFAASAAGTGTLQVKTYLKSSGTSACEVDNLQFTGKKY